MCAFNKIIPEPKTSVGKIVLTLCMMLFFAAGLVESLLSAVWRRSIGALLSVVWRRCRSLYRGPEVELD